MNKVHTVLLGLVVAAGAPAGSVPEDVTCAGTEPFWTITIKEGRGTFSALGDGEDHGFTVGQDAFGDFDGFATGAGQWIHGRLTSGQILRLAYFEASCSDNMSANEYAYLALVEHPNGSHLSGCCEVVETYTVTGIDEGDLLNVRSQPQSKAEIVDRLANETFGIHTLECQGNWCRIRYQKTVEGWVHKRYIEPYRP